jgi:phosphoribosylformimino-5-aminoimidazole carboxamide ribotide isomerase
MEEIPTRQGIFPPSPLAALRPRIIPVMDVRADVVVRAIAGRREEYCGIVSRLTDSYDPLVVAEALRQFVGTDELYMADLDAIMDGRPNYRLMTELASRGFRTWVDAGVSVEACDELLVHDTGCAVVIVGLEKVNNPVTLWGMCFSCGAENIAFSLDLKNGQPLGRRNEWHSDPRQIIGDAEAIGVTRLIILDLSRVGTGTGTGTEDLCAWAKSKYPHLELIAGGGVRGPEDLPRLQAAGVDAVLVASALHDGRFGLPETPL